MVPGTQEGSSQHQLDGSRFQSIPKVDLKKSNLGGAVLAWGAEVNTHSWFNAPHRWPNVGEEAFPMGTGEPGRGLRHSIILHILKTEYGAPWLLRQEGRGGDRGRESLSRFQRIPNRSYRPDPTAPGSSNSYFISLKSLCSLKVHLKLLATWRGGH